MADVFRKCSSYDRVREMVAEGAYPYYRPIHERNSSTDVIIDGRPAIMAGSNDYLGLASDPRVTSAAIRAVEQYGASCSGSRVVNGTLGLHEELEGRLAAFLRRPAAAVVTTGFQTNLALSVLLGRHDVVFGDRLNHASLLDATLLGLARYRRYRHLDTSHLHQLLDSADPDTGRLIMTDGLFSMEGDLCDLPGIVKLGKQYGARVVVDCAHDLGLFGTHGRGVPEYYGLEADIDIVTGTFSKCFGSLGGVIAGPSEVVHFIRHTARSIVFSASMPPSAVAAALAALDIIEAEPERRMRVFALAERLHAGLRAGGFDTGRATTPIVPVRIGGDLLCRRFWSALLDAGVFANAVVAPAVPEGHALIRVILTANHTDDQLGRVIDAFTAVGRRLGVLS